LSRHKWPTLRTSKPPAIGPPARGGTIAAMIKWIRTSRLAIKNSPTGTIAAGPQKGEPYRVLLRNLNSRESDLRQSQGCNNHLRPPKRGRSWFRVQGDDRGAGDVRTGRGLIRSLRRGLLRETATPRPSWEHETTSDASRLRGRGIVRWLSCVSSCEALLENVLMGSCVQDR